MGERIIIHAGDVIAEATLNDTETARRIAAALPIEGEAMRWGDEIYFPIPVDCPPENPKAVVQAGDLGYWVPGKAFCIFFGPTPASRSPDEIRPTSPVNVFGQIVGDPTVFRAVTDGTKVRVERAR